MRSLLYQLYESTRDQALHGPLKDDTGQILNKSSQSKAITFASLRHLFSNHIYRLPSAMIILDALNECQDPDSLIQGLKSLFAMSSVKIMVTSRRESHLGKLVSDCMSFEITPEDVNADTVAFIEAKPTTSRWLSHSLVRNKVFVTLSKVHDGMFLWICLMLKELKSCFL